MDEALGLFFTFWHIVGRRRWLALIVAWGICVAGWFGVASLPEQYEAKAQIYVDTSTLLGPLLKGLAVQDDIQQQVSVIKRTLFTRPNLEKVIRDNDLDLEVQNSEDLQALLESIEGKAKIATTGSNLFTVSYQDNNPVLARDITKTFLDIFISTNVGRNRTGMETARSFIENQIAKYEKQLSAAEKRLAEFRTANADMLSGGEFFTRYDALRTEYLTTERQLNDAKLAEKQLLSRLEKTPRFLEVEKKPIETEDKVDELKDLRADLDKAKEALDLALLKYTDSHPDVVRMRALAKKAQERYDEKKAEIEAEKSSNKPKEFVTTEIPNNLYEELQLRIFDVEQAKAALESKFARLQVEYETMQEQKKTAPQIEAKLQGLDRDYTVIKKQFEALLQRRESASISAAREASTDAVQFRVVEPPQIPAVPIGPKRLIFSSGVLIVGLGAGFAVPILLALVSGCFYSRRQLEDAFDLPVLGTVGYVPGTLNSAGRLINNVASFGVLALLITSFGAVIYFAPEPSMLKAAMERVMDFADQYNIPYYIERIKEVLNR